VVKSSVKRRRRLVSNIETFLAIVISIGSSVVIAIFFISKGPERIFEKKNSDDMDEDITKLEELTNYKDHKMKKNQIALLIIGVLLIVAALTNPNTIIHKEAIKSRLHKATQQEDVSVSDNEWGNAGSALGMMFAGTFIDKIVDQMITVDNYILFSVTKGSYGGNTRTIGFGAFGNVYITNEVDNALAKASLDALPAIQPVSNEELKRLSAGFGYRIDPYLKTRKKHTGVDFSLEVGNPVHATGEGKIKYTKSSLSGYGKQVHIDHDFGFQTKYGHLDKILVKKSQWVKRGDLIGYSGNSGKSTAPHLHYEVIKNGIKVNPIHYFSRDLSAEEYEEILRLDSIENQAMGS